MGGQVGLTGGCKWVNRLVGPHRLKRIAQRAPSTIVDDQGRAFVRQFSLNLRADLAGTALRVTDVEPGLCGGTEFSAVRLHGDQAKADAVYAGTTPLSADDVADAVHWVASRPAHVNINHLQLMPECQAIGPLAVKRREAAN